jgi:hypothetical protein
MNSRKPRIVDPEWWDTRPAAIGVVNANYTRCGTRVATHDKPWVATSHHIFKTFHTHRDALTYAFSQVPEPDPTPQEQEHVTSGWKPQTDRFDAWQEKQELTR